MIKHRKTIALMVPLRMGVRLVCLGDCAEEAQGDVGMGRHVEFPELMGPEIVDEWGILIDICIPAAYVEGDWEVWEPCGVFG